MDALPDGLELAGLASLGRVNPQENAIEQEARVDVHPDLRESLSVVDFEFAEMVEDPCHFGGQVGWVQYRLKIIRLAEETVEGLEFCNYVTFKQEICEERIVTQIQLPQRCLELTLQVLKTDVFNLQLPHLPTVVYLGEYQDLVGFSIITDQSAA